MQRRDAFQSAAKTMVRRVPWCGSFLLCLLVVAVACGPIEYVNQVTRKASSEVEAAKAVKADKHSPYWYTLAVEYLHKAREEAAAADFQSANLFGRRSAKAARKARSLAVERARDPASRPQLTPADEEEIEIIDPTSEEATTDADDNPLDDAPIDDAADDQNDDEESP